jgi:hypothetical protein
MTVVSPELTGLEEAEALLRVRDLAGALAAFDHAEADGADHDRCAAGRWMADMLDGDFAAAWRESDAIRERSAPDPHRLWGGEDLRGKKVIVRCLHGLGDAVQLLRYASLLRSRCAAVVYEVPPAFVELAPYFEGVTDVIPWGDDAPGDLPLWDVQIEVNEVPYIFRTKADDLPIATEYLRLPQAILCRTSLGAHQADTLRIGVVWGSGEWNSSRSIALELLQAGLQTPGCEFWNLQGGSKRSEWSRLAASPLLHPAEECATSLLNLSAFIAQLDLVITTDTLAAHLAGAQGTAAWVMLEHAADWRWQHNRSDSPWYPSLRLFRQPAPRDWRSVAASIREALRLHAASRQCQVA